MLSPELLERVSLYVAGELPQGERALLEDQIRADPEVAQAVERMRRLDGLFAELGEEDATAISEDVILGAVNAAQPSRWPRYAVAAAILIVLGATIVLQNRNPSAVDARREIALAKLRPETTTAVESSRILSVKNGRIYLAENTVAQVDNAQTVMLERGSLAVEGRAAVRIQEALITIDGIAGVSREPGDVVLHVMSGLKSIPHTQDLQMKMSNGFKTKLVVATAAASVFVAQGTADARTPEAPAARVAPGEHWTASASMARTSAKNRDGGMANRFNVKEMQGLREALQPSLSALMPCYAEGLRRSPDLAGEITTHLKLGPPVDGSRRITEVTIDPNYSLGDPFVMSCVVQVLGQTTVKGGADLPNEAEMPIDFHPTTTYPHEGKVATRAARVEIVQLIDGDKLGLTPTDGTPQIGSSPSRGSLASGVEVVEFTDPGCSYCVKAHPVLNALFAEYGDRVHFVLKFGPSPVDERSPIAEQAILAAGQQGKLWEMFDEIVAHPDAIDRAGANRLAQALGLNASQFAQALESQRFEPTLAADAAECKRLHIKALPMVFIDGHPLIGDLPIERFRTQIDEALRKRSR